MKTRRTLINSFVISTPKSGKERNSKSAKKIRPEEGSSETYQPQPSSAHKNKAQRPHIPFVLDQYPARGIGVECVTVENVRASGRPNSGQVQHHEAFLELGLRASAEINL